ncbi:MAG: helix-turn-helix transcriptional regulator [Muribaculaceae bacterium]|nr:helix-turn-helix transcriptional regulator [Muribaculaceae bacterium]
MYSTVIIDKDTLRALGLKHLMERYFDTQLVIVQELRELDSNDISPSALFFTSPQCYIAFQDFFIPRRSRTVILTSDNLTDIATLDPRTDESSIIENLNSIISERAIEKSRPHNELSQREIDVLRLVAMGYINKEIADELSISFNTVLTHRKNITAKLGIRSVSGLGFYAMMNGYISESDIRR